MKPFLTICIALLFAFKLNAQGPLFPPVPKIEIVFCLDATGSMGGLIATAKEKIWDIVTRLTQTNPAPEIKVGMVFYRDRKDDFITKFCPLTTDIDSIYDVLLSMKATGGGDSPESVNQALHEAVSQMQWTSYAYKTIFIVGDCPPHMDYKDDVLYPVSCTEAQSKGIFINTIKLGTQCSEAIRHFQTMASSTKGEYIQLGQNAEDITIKTPYDDSVNYYSFLIDSTMIYYGSVQERTYNTERKEKSKEFYEKGSSTSNADRVKYNKTTSGKANWFGTHELIQDLIEGKISIDSLSKTKLPDKLAKMTKEELKIYLGQKIKERKSAMAHLDRLTKTRDAFIAEEKKKTRTDDGFSEKVFRIIQGQAKSVEVEIGG